MKNLNINFNILRKIKLNFQKIFKKIHFLTISIFIISIIIILFDLHVSIFLNKAFCLSNKNFVHLSLKYEIYNATKAFIHPFSKLSYEEIFFILNEFRQNLHCLNLMVVSLTDLDGNKFHPRSLLGHSGLYSFFPGNSSIGIFNYLTTHPEFRGSNMDWFAKISDQGYIDESKIQYMCKYPFIVEKGFIHVNPLTHPRILPFLKNNKSTILNVLNENFTQACSSIY